MDKKVLSMIFLVFISFIFNFCNSNSLEPNEFAQLEEIRQYSDKLVKIDPLLVIVLMVKNEAHNIRETLEPFVKSKIDSYLILDTGSTDDTIDVARKLFEENQIKNAYIEQEPFVDFSTSRNKALDLAKEKFPNAAFLLMLDAEWYLHNVDSLIKFCEQKILEHISGKAELLDAYLLRIIYSDGALDFYTSRLIRAQSKVKFVGRIHEALNYVTNEKVFSDVFFEYRPTQKGWQTSANRHKRDLQILLEEYNLKPNDSRTIFYLAQTYESLGDLENAYKYYKMRAKLRGWDEEDFITIYRLGQIKEKICQDCNSKKDSFCAEKYYKRAFSLRPTRAEPLVKIAENYLRKNNMTLCYLYAKAACEIPYPKDDILFVEKKVYDFTRYDVLGICSWYVGQFEIGKRAIVNALVSEPNNNRLIKNLEFYKD